MSDSKNSSDENLIKFNKLYSDFLTDLKNVFSFINPSKFDEKDFLTFFSINNLPYMNDISKANESVLVENKDIFIISGVTFSKIFNNNDYEITQNTKNSIWSYLHSLYVFLLSLNTSNKDYINTLDKNVKNNIEKYVDNSKLCTDVINNIKTFRNNMNNVNINVNNNVNNNSNSSNSSNFLENSAIGSLAKELQEELKDEDLPNIENPSDLFSQMASGEGNIMSVVSKVMNKMDQKMKSGEINQQTLMNEATGLLGMMTGNGGGENNSNNLFSMMSGLMGGGNASGEGANDLMSNMMNLMNNGDNNNSSSGRVPKKHKHSRSKRRELAKAHKKAQKKANKLKQQKNEDAVINSALDDVLGDLDDNQTLTVGEMKKLLSKHNKE